jgi:hypothetical protein
LSKGLSSGGGEEWKPIQIADKNEISVWILQAKSQEPQLSVSAIEKIQNP